ncbi:MAG: hypothetical protein LAP13_07550, partial [Acidobacteriia bacterium]|nr:hypothetical protein [Terriglobia bacterium]
NSSTFALQSTGASVLGFAHDRVAGSTFRVEPNQTIKRGRLRVPKSFVSHATQTSQGTKMPRANWNVLVNYPVVLPSPALYQQFDGLVLDIVNQIQNAVFRIRNLRCTRDLLLPRLISGELDVEKLDIAVPEVERSSEIARVASVTP